MSLISSFIEVSLKNESDFLKVKETLSRIGVAKASEKKLFQSCHILHKQGKYYIVHFKELFALDGKPNNFSDDDKARRNTIAGLLEEWGLVSIVNPSVCEIPRASMKNIKIIPFKSKNEWLLESKYQIGRKQNRA